MNRQDPLFSNATELMDWMNRNCDECRKGPTEYQQGDNPLCAIETAIAWENMGELVPMPIYWKLIIDDKLVMVCPEFEPKTPVAKCSRCKGTGVTKYRPLDGIHRYSWEPWLEKKCFYCDGTGNQ